MKIKDLLRIIEDYKLTDDTKITMVDADYTEFEDREEVTSYAIYHDEYDVNTEIVIIY